MYNFVVFRCWNLDQAELEKVIKKNHNGGYKRWDLLLPSKTKHHAEEMIHCSIVHSKIDISPPD